MKRITDQISARGCYRLFKDGEFVEEGQLKYLCDKYEFNSGTVMSASYKYGSYIKNGWEFKRHEQTIKVVDRINDTVQYLTLTQVYELLGIRHRKSLLEPFFQNHDFSRYHLFINQDDLEVE